MFEKENDTQLLVYLGYASYPTFFANCGYDDPVRLRQLIRRHGVEDELRVGALINKGIYLGVVPIGLVSMLVTLGVVTSPVILTGLVIGGLFSSVILGLYAITNAANQRAQHEQELIKKQIWLETKLAICTILNKRINDALEVEFKNWIPMTQNFNPREYGQAFRDKLLKELSERDKQLKFSQVVLAYPRNKKDSIVHVPFMTTAIVSALFGSLFWGTTHILGAFGFTLLAAAMVSPIGIAFGVLAALGIGIALGYQRHLYLNHFNQTENRLTMLKNRFAIQHANFQNNLTLYTKLKELFSSKNSEEQPPTPSKKVQLSNSLRSFTIGFFADKKNRTTEDGKRFEQGLVYKF